MGAWEAAGGGSCSETLSPVTPTGDLSGIPGSCPWPGLTATAVGISGVNQYPVHETPLSVSLFLSLSLSFQIKK